MQPEDPFDSFPQEVLPLEFSEPRCWCESTAHYINLEGQEFEVRVRGENPDVVLAYVKEVQMSLQVVLSEDETPKEKEISEQDEKYRSMVDQFYNEIRLRPELDLDIEIEVLHTPGIELPYTLNMGIDPSIGGGQTHRYHAKAKARKIKVNLSASQNGVSGYLSGGGVSVRDQADTYAPDPPKKKARFMGEAGSESQFYFSVTGMRAANKYSVGSSIKLVR